MKNINKIKGLGAICLIAGVLQGGSASLDRGILPVTQEAIRGPKTPLGTFSLLPDATPYLELVLSTSAKYGVDPAIALSVMKNESNFSPTARSNKGAIGLMQVLPSTASWVLDFPTSADDLENPSINIEAGIAYLAYVEKKVSKYPNHNKLIFAGYNAGHGRVMRGKVPNFKETKVYVQRCLKTFKKLTNKV